MPVLLLFLVVVLARAWTAAGAERAAQRREATREAREARQATPRPDRRA